MNFIFADYIGEICALGAAVFWAGSSILFGKCGKKMSSLEMNILKGILALAILGITLVFANESVFNIQTLPLILLCIGGIMSIGLGDTAYFKSLENFGPRYALLMATLSPVMTAIFALLFLGEELSMLSWAGILVTIVGVIWVITEKQNGQNGDQVINLKAGILFGLLSAFGQSVAAVLSRTVITISDVTPLQITFFRQFFGLIFLFILIFAMKKPLLQWRHQPDKKRTIIYLVSATLLGAFLAIWFQQVAIKYTMVGIAQTLSATSPIFILPMLWIGGEKFSFRSVAGALVAMVGIWLLFQ